MSNIFPFFSMCKIFTSAYLGPYTRIITKLFHNTELEIGLRRENIIKQHLGTKEKTNDKYNRSGVYLMTYEDFPLKYVTQTGRTFRTRYNEHIREIKTNGETSKYAQHLLDTPHDYEQNKRNNENFTH
jgi:hypothetical protein